MKERKKSRKRKREREDSGLPSTLPHTSVKREPFGKHLSPGPVPPVTPSSAFPLRLARITPYLGFVKEKETRGDHRFSFFLFFPSPSSVTTSSSFSSSSSSPVRPFAPRFFQIAARPLEKDCSSSTRCLKIRQLCAPRHFLLREAGSSWKRVVLSFSGHNTPRNFSPPRPLRFAFGLVDLRCFFFFFPFFLSLCLFFFYLRDPVISLRLPERGGRKNSRVLS